MTRGCHERTLSSRHRNQGPPLTATTFGPARVSTARTDFEPANRSTIERASGHAVAVREIDIEGNTDKIGDSQLLWEAIEESFWVVQAGLDGAEVHLLSIGQRRLASLLLVWAGIENGGFSEPLVNSGGDWLIEALDAAEMIGAFELARHLRLVVSLLGCSETDFVDRTSRQRLADALSDEDFASIDADVDSFIDWYELAENYIRLNPSEFP